MRGPRAHIFFLVDMEVINFFLKFQKGLWNQKDK